MQELLVKEEIENMIYEIRGKQVMLERDVALLYNTLPKRINELVKRNIERFPDDFCFRINEKELNNLWSQNAAANVSNKSRTLPYVFTEYGIIMLSGLLNNSLAIEVNKKVIKAFVKMKNYLLTENNRINNIERKMLFYDTKLIDHDDKFETLFNQFKTKNNHIFFEGQIYDAYSLLIDILKNAKEEIIIIDNYASKELFDILKDIKVNTKIVTKNINDILIKKYNKQYSNIKIIYNDSFHDRFIIIDKKILYHSGASFKDLGNKCFGINKIKDKEYLERIINKIEGD